MFNGGEQLLLSVRSILNQTFSDWELLILDDGSTDGAPERVLLLGDTRVRILRDGQNKGLAVRLNQAISLARGTYFARMDHDDICHPERLARQIQFLKSNSEIDLLATQCLAMNEQEEIVGALPIAISHDEICRRPWQGFYMAHPTWVGKTSWFQAHLYKTPAPYCCEDQELLLRASEVSRYHTLPLNLLAYRVRSRTSWEKLWRTRLDLAKVQSSYFLRRRLYGNAFLSLISGVLRLTRDFQRRYLPLGGPAKRHFVLRSELQAWEGLIAELKDCARNDQ